MNNLSISLWASSGFICEENRFRHPYATSHIRYRFWSPLIISVLKFAFFPPKNSGQKIKSINPIQPSSFTFRPPVFLIGKSRIGQKVHFGTNFTTVIRRMPNWKTMPIWKMRNFHYGKFQNLSKFGKMLYNRFKRYYKKTTSGQDLTGSKSRYSIIPPSLCKQR